MGCPAVFAFSAQVFYTVNIIAAGIHAAKGSESFEKLLKRRYSLKRNKRFRYVYRVGKAQGCALMTLIYARSRERQIHVGFSVSKKIGNSVVRNRVKRRLRESFSPLIPFVKSGYDLIFIAREPVTHAPFAEIQSQMRRLLRKSGLLPAEE